MGSDFEENIFKSLSAGKIWGGGGGGGGNNMFLGQEAMSFFTSVLTSELMTYFAAILE